MYLATIVVALSSTLGDGIIQKMAPHPGSKSQGQPEMLYNNNDAVALV